MSTLNNPVQVSFRINYHSPEWLAIKAMLEKEREQALQHLIKEGLSEVVYAQWRGRVALANKILGFDTTLKSVTE